MQPYLAAPFFCIPTIYRNALIILIRMHTHANAPTYLVKPI